MTPTKIDQKIVGVSVKGDEPAPVEAQAPVLLVAERPRTVEGKTYKISPPDHASIYITINDIETPHGKRPVELFIVSRVQESYQWITLVTRLASAVFRQQALHKEYNTFVVQEFLSTFDPGKQYFSSHYKGRFMNSLVMEIGLVMQDHLAGLGLMDPVKHKGKPAIEPAKEKQSNEQPTRALQEENRPPADPSPPTERGEEESKKDPGTGEENRLVTRETGIPTQEAQGYTADDVSAAAEATEVWGDDELEAYAASQKERPKHGACPKCFGDNLQMMDGCLTCLDCGDSKCN